MRIMGVINVTPDSFSDGGAYPTLQAAIDAALKMVDEGADLIDVGGESTRPGSHPIALEEELSRTTRVVNALSQRGVNVSIDTSKASVAREALAAGATFVNDVTALGDPEMASICGEAGCEVCLMHMKGNPLNMQQDPSYDNVVEEVTAYLIQRAELAKKEGIKKILLDPGIGFGKTDTHNLLLIKHLDRLVATGYPVLLGVSRKGFLGRLLAKDGQPAAALDRLEAGLAIQSFAQLHGVAVIRTHDVRAAVRVANTLSRLI